MDKRNEVMALKGIQLSMARTRSSSSPRAAQGITRSCCCQMCGARVQESVKEGRQPEGPAENCGAKGCRQDGVEGSETKLGRYSKGASAAKKSGEARGGALEKPHESAPRRVSEGPVSHQKAAFSPRHHRALLAGRSHTSAACTRLSRGS